MVKERRWRVAGETTFLNALLVKGGMKVAKHYFVKILRFLEGGEKELDGSVDG